MIYVTRHRQLERLGIRIASFRELAEAMAHHLLGFATFPTLPFGEELGHDGSLVMTRRERGQ